MTLLESVVALVIVGLAAVGFLNLFESDSRLPGTAREWAAAISYAEEGMELAKIGQSAPIGAGRGFSRTVERTPYTSRLDQIRVIVTMSDGRKFELRRLQPR